MSILHSCERGKPFFDCALFYHTCLVGVVVRDKQRTGRDDASAGTTTLFLAIHHPFRSSHQGPAVGRALRVSTLQSSAIFPGGAQRQAARGSRGPRAVLRVGRDGDRERRVGPHRHACYCSAVVYCHEFRNTWAEEHLRRIRVRVWGSCRLLRLQLQLRGLCFCVVALFLSW